jgi:tetratricopeptide (TPR) repeat protein
MTEERATLEKALLEQPRNATLHHLLGADLAQSGEYDAAVSSMRQAIAIDPNLHVARFQLGLLLLTMAQPQESLAVLAPLESQPQESLRCFKRGLEALIRDDFTTCLAELGAGVQASPVNIPLNRDMEMLASRVRVHIDQQTQPASTANSVRTDFSLYDQTRQ